TMTGWLTTVSAASILRMVDFPPAIGPATQTHAGPTSLRPTVARETMRSGVVLGSVLRSLADGGGCLELVGQDASVRGPWGQSSQPMPLPSESNPCGSPGRTLKPRSLISEQSRSGDSG